MGTHGIAAKAFLAPTPAVAARTPRATQQAEVQATPKKAETSTPLSEEKLRDAAAVANKALSSLNTGVRLRVDQESNQVVAQFVDANNTVIKQIPPEDMLRIAASMQKLEGLLFNKQG